MLRVSGSSFSRMPTKSRTLSKDVAVAVCTWFSWGSNASCSSWSTSQATHDRVKITKSARGIGIILMYVDTSAHIRLRSSRSPFDKPPASIALDPTRELSRARPGPAESPVRLAASWPSRPSNAATPSYLLNSLHDPALIRGSGCVSLTRTAGAIVLWRSIWRPKWATHHGGWVFQARHKR